MKRLPPRHLDAAARRKWQELLPTLADGTPGTLDALTLFCDAWSRWLLAEDDAARLRWSRACRQWLAELKLTPKSKTRRSAESEPSTDPVLRLMRKAHDDEIA
ncbi:MAG: hypothetical protein GXX96_07655 [Planctomycetaceae bacterium]|jgi:phage terminase small subunit|nr:hypothetical protein [Planctomycetaceae bacterium]